MKCGIYFKVTGICGKESSDHGNNMFGAPELRKYGVFKKRKEPLPPEQKRVKRKK